MLKNRTPGGEEFITGQTLMFIDNLMETRETVEEFNAQWTRSSRAWHSS